MIDEKKLQQFLGKMIVDLGAAMSLPLVRIGVRLGLYKAMNEVGPMTSAEFAKKANISERYAREWLAQNAASGYLTYDPASRRFFDHGLRAGIPIAGGGYGAGRPSQTGETDRSNQGGRLQSGPSSRGNAA